MSSVASSVGTPSPSLIEVVRDQDVTLTFTLADAGGHAVDITHDSVTFVVKSTYGGTVEIATMTNITGQHVDPTNGTTQFTITQAALDAATTAGVMDSWVYEVRRLTGGTSPNVIYLRGEFRVLPSVNAG